MDLYELVLEHEQYLKQEIKKLEKSVKKENTRILFSYKNHNGFRYYTKISNTRGVQRKPISVKKKDSLQSLALKSKDYYQLSDYRLELEAIHAYCAKYNPQTRRTMKFLQNPGIQVLLNDYSNDSLTEWQSADYSTNPYQPENRSILVTESLAVRSKSEAQIASMLIQKGIPFRYESKLSLQGTTLFPDFTIRPTLNSSPIYWEHFGMMDDYSYRTKTAEKLYSYIMAGYTPDKDLIMTFETKDHPLDIITIQKKIEGILSQMK